MSYCCCERILLVFLLVNNNLCYGMILLYNYIYICINMLFRGNQVSHQVRVQELGL